MAYRKVRFADSPIVASIDFTAPPSLSFVSRKTKRLLRPKSLFRLVCSMVFALLALNFIRPYFLQKSGLYGLKARDTVLGNCVKLEALRNSKDCIESFDINRNNKGYKTSRLSKPDNEDGRRKWVSPFGVALDYDVEYDIFTPASADDERYSTKRTLKCNIGFGMSIVWDFEFQTSLLQAYKSGTYGINPNTPDGQIATSCPNPNEESSAAMDLTINCGVDIDRDPWGNPASEKDHESLETCTRMAWSWVREHVGNDTAPWSDLCRDVNGHFECNRNVFQLEGRNP